MQKPPNPFGSILADAGDRYVGKYMKFFGGEVRKHSNVLFILTTMMIVGGIIFIVLGTVLNVQRIK
jgi:hypothetical protein